MAGQEYEENKSLVTSEIDDYDDDSNDIGNEINVGPAPQEYGDDTELVPNGGNRILVNDPGVESDIRDGVGGEVNIGPPIQEHGGINMLDAQSVLDGESHVLVNDSDVNFDMEMNRVKSQGNDPDVEFDIADGVEGVVNVGPPIQEHGGIDIVDMESARYGERFVLAMVNDSDVDSDVEMNRVRSQVNVSDIQFDLQVEFDGVIIVLDDCDEEIVVSVESIGAIVDELF